MRTLFTLLLGLMLAGWPGGAVAEELKTGATKFLAYEGRQDWPTGAAVEARSDFAVPIYRGLPEKKFKVLGRVVDDRDGVDLVGKELGGFFGGSQARLRHCANQAKRNGGDAVVITDHAAVLKVFGLTRKAAGDESPLATDRRNVVLVVKF